MGARESENEPDWPLPGFSPPPETHSLFAPSPALQAQRLPGDLSKSQRANLTPSVPPAARPSLLLVPPLTAASLSPFPSSLGSREAPFSGRSRPPPTPLLACSTFLAWRSPRCAQVAGSAACCPVPAAVT